MKKVYSIILFVFFLPSALVAKPDTVVQANQLLQKKHYTEVVVFLQEKIRSINKKQRPMANLTLGIAYYKNSKLHGKLYNASLSSLVDYLTQLEKVKGKRSSKYVNLFLGETYLELKKYRLARKHLNKVKRNRIDEDQWQFAQINKGIALYSLKQKSKAKNIWKKIKTNNVELLSELAYAYTRVGINQSEVTVLINKIQTSKLPYSVRTLSNLIYVTAKKQDKDLVNKHIYSTDLTKAAFEENINDEKKIKFYEPALLGNLALYYQWNSIRHLKEAKKTEKYSNMAAYILSQIYYDSRQWKNVLKQISQLVDSKKVSDNIRIKAKITGISTQYMQGRKKIASSNFKELAKKYNKRPNIQAEIVLACVSTKMQCDQIIKVAEAQAGNGVGRKYRKLFYALGKYYSGIKVYEAAITYMEMARDKSNKNRIDANDPELLVDLAEIYRKKKVFNENLEIYFEMSKQFPVIRQIQNSVQGIYSMEQRSAGDVKIL